jgi:uncharacterized protein YcnI
MTHKTRVALFAAVSLFAWRTAEAHVSVVSGYGLANATQEITFGVGHGCSGADTVGVRVEIPASVTSVRPMRSDFGKVSVEKDAAGAVTAVVWQKADADVLSDDIAYYKLVVRLKVPSAPFTTVYFPAHQTCRGGDGGVSSVDWVGLPGAGSSPDAGEAEPAPALSIVPAHGPGWNKVTAPIAVTNLATFFSDALIVWKGTAAYSANAATTELIKNTPGVSALTSIGANDELWVKY